MFKLMLSALIALLAVGCSAPHYVDYFPYHDDGTPKPKVALVPVKDSSQANMPWDVSEELSEGIYYELMNSGQLYVMLPQEVGPVWAKRNSIDFFAGDMSFTRDFCNTDFIVAMELVDHSINACNEDNVGKTFPHCHPSNRVLSLRMRVKVIDVRCETPRVVLYEIVKADYIVAPSCDIDYTTTCWGTKGYSVTPWYTAHARMIKNISIRLEEVLWSVK